jgi:hypothetical protein
VARLWTKLVLEVSRLLRVTNIEMFKLQSNKLFFYFTWCVVCWQRVLRTSILCIWATSDFAVKFGVWAAKLNIRIEGNCWPIQNLLPSPYFAIILSSLVYNNFNHHVSLFCTTPIRFQCTLDPEVPLALSCFRHAHSVSNQTDKYDFESL